MPTKAKSDYRNPNYHERRIILRRGLDPTNYVVIKNTPVALYLRDQRTGLTKIINKQN